jgi:hypothetical protein
MPDRFDENGKAFAELPPEFDPDYEAPAKPDPFAAEYGGIPKVYYNDPEHDEKVRELIAVGMELIERRGLLCGIGVMDFDDCTVVAVSQRIPHREVFETRLEGQNSILHGRFGLN